MPSIKGTASVADPRARSKALKSTKFPKIFSNPVQLSKVNKPVLRQWIEQRVTTILGFEDEIVSSTAINLFLPSEEGSSPDPRRAQLDLVGFLGEEQSATFSKELWNLLLEAQASGTGIPRKLLEEKKKELSQRAMAAKTLESASSGFFSASSADLTSGASIRPSSSGMLEGAVPSNQNPRHPEMNRFVQEAARRAHAARQMVDAQEPLERPPMLPAADANGQPTPIPISPAQDPLDMDHSPAQKGSSSHASGGKRKDPPKHEMDFSDDRKMPAKERGTQQFRPFQGSAAVGSRNNPHAGEDRAHRSYGSASRGSKSREQRRDSGSGVARRSKSRSLDRLDVGDRDYDRDGRRFRGHPRRQESRDRYRLYREDDDEIHELERRLSDLKRQISKRRDDYALDEEIEDVKDRIYELERRRRRHRKECSRREVNEDYHRKKHRRRESPERSRRRSRSPVDGDASASDRSLSSSSRRPSYVSKSRPRSGRDQDDRKREGEDDRKRGREEGSKKDREGGRKRDRDDDRKGKADRNRDRDEDHKGDSNDHSSESSDSSNSSGSYSD
jgi:serine/arginine repetitive matrix protein 1